MRKLDLYLSRQFVNILGTALTGFLCIFIIVDVIEQLDKFIDNSVPLGIVLRYYLYTLPWFINIGLPMAMLIASIFCIGLLAKRNELTAMKSSGISVYRIAVPIFLIGIIISFISFVFENRLVILGNERRNELKNEYMEKTKHHRKDFKKNIFLQRAEKYHMAIGKYHDYTKTAENVSYQLVENGRIRQRIDTPRMVWNDTLQAWSIQNYSIRTFNRQGEESQVRLSPADTLLALGLTPEDIDRKSSSPEELNYDELKRFIVELQGNGVDATRWEVVRHFKFSFAFTNLIVVMFGLPLVLLRPKSGLSFGAGISVFIIFSYYAFIKFGQSLGYKGLLDPLLSAWIGNIVFSVGGLVLLKMVRK